MFLSLGYVQINMRIFIINIFIIIVIWSFKTLLELLIKPPLFIRIELLHGKVYELETEKEKREKEKLE